MLNPNYLIRAEKSINLTNSYNEETYLNNTISKKDYLAFCANLYNFLPDIEEERYADFYKEVLLNQTLAGIEQEFPDIIYETEIDGEFKEFYRSTIFCTFHYASYRLINLFLMKSSINYDLVIAEKPLKEQGESFYKANDLAKKIYKTTGEFRILNAESRSGIVEAIKTLKSGGNLLFYIDGNTGIGSNNDNPNMINIDFLKSKILSRAGISFFSQHTDSPIIPLIANRKETFDHTIKIYPPIKADKLLDKSENLKIMTQSLFDCFSEHMKEKFELWECWLYLEKFIPKIEKENRETCIESNSKTKYEFNKKRYKEVVLDNDYFLFDRKLYSFLPINNEFYNNYKADVINYKQDVLQKLISYSIVI